MINREDVLHDELKKLEENCIDRIDINASDFMKKIGGENFNKYYLILLGKVLKERGWIMHRRRKGYDSRRMYEYIKINNKGMWE